MLNIFYKHGRQRNRQPFKIGQASLLNVTACKINVKLAKTRFYGQFVMNCSHMKHSSLIHI